MKWLLDTDVVIDAIRDRPPEIRHGLRRESPEELGVSSVTVAELAYGAMKSQRPDRTRALFERFLEPFEILPFDRSAAERHGRVRYELRHRPIGERDLLIAAIALAHDLVVITRNTREFDRVPGLECWIFDSD